MLRSVQTVWILHAGGALPRRGLCRLIVGSPARAPFVFLFAVTGVGGYGGVELPSFLDSQILEVFC